MKMFTKLWFAVALAVMVFVVGCSNSAGGSSGGGNEPRELCYTIKPSADLKAVGDLILNDGTVLTPDAGGSPLTQEQKDAAIAIIFYVGNGLNSGVDTSTRTLGVGLKYYHYNHRNGLSWCSDSAAAFEKRITTIECKKTGVNYTFTGDKNGSDNLEQIGAFLGNDNDTTGEGAADRYPAFYFAKNYKDTAANIKDTAYESGWYLPSIAELIEIWKVRKTVNAASVIFDGPNFSRDCFWSSSQTSKSISEDSFAHLILGDSTEYQNEPDSEYFPKNAQFEVCAIREF